jgi:hypothetical protein
MLKKSLLFLLFLSVAAFSQNPKLSENARVSIFTCGRGDELYSTFGHTALRIKDETNYLDVVFNYGAFDFSTDNFYFKFVKGDLQYFMTVTSFEDFILEYQMDKRSVIEQVLNLTAAQKQMLFDQLNTALNSSDRYYTYKFIDRNCTTMVAEKISAVTNGKPLQKVDDTTSSYREVLYPYFENYYWSKLGINIVFGIKTDTESQKLFLPIELMHSLDKAKNNGQPLVSETHTIVTDSRSEPAFSFMNSGYVILAFLLIVLIINKRWLFMTYLCICGLLGIFICLVGFYSQHQELLWNYNALLFCPLFLLLPFVNENFRKKMVMLSLALLCLYGIIMVNKPDLVLLLPFMLAHFYMLLKISGKLLPTVK